MCCKGAETSEELEVPQKEDRDNVQGYHIGRPIPPDQLAELAAGWNSALLGPLDAKAS